MGFLKQLAHHERLFSKMSDLNGADVALAMQRGMVDPEDVRTAVFSCTACTNPQDCEERLSAEKGGFPEYCRNADMLKAIAGKLSVAD